MNKNKVEYIFGIALVLVMALSGCNLSVMPQTPTPIPDAAYTAAAETVIAQLTQVASVATPTAPPILVPSATNPILPTEVQGAIPTDTLLTTEVQGAIPTDTPVPTEPPLPIPTGTPTNVPEILFEDDFTYDTGWYTDKGDDFSFEYAHGGYRISVDILNAPIWSIRERYYSDVRLEVDAVQLSGAQDGYYGLVCRHNDSDNYYALVIGSDGSFGIAKSQDGEFEFIETGTAPPGVINPGEAVNRVRADCVGDTMTLYANDQKLSELRDVDFEFGYIGLIAGTRLSGGVVVLFDNFTIYQP